MRKLFIQFYLILVVCFSVAVLLIGGLYNRSVDKISTSYLNDIFHSSFTLLNSELSDVPKSRWGEEIARLHMPYQISIWPIDAYELSAENVKALKKGEIIMLEDSYEFLQRIPKSSYMMKLGPINYLRFLHQLESWDYLVLALLGLLLGIPAFLWMRPLWRQLQHLDQVARQLGNGNLEARATLPDSSPVHDLGNTFNGMAGNIQQLMQSKRELVDAVSHELRTPIARLRYRIALQQSTQPENSALAAMEGDIGVIDNMIEGLLLHSRLDHSKIEVQPVDIDVLPWLQQVLSEHRPDTGQLTLQLHNHTGLPNPQLSCDSFYLKRALSNLLRNASRYARHTIDISLGWNDNIASLIVDDDGPGIPEQERDNVFQPFVRLDTSRDRRTGGYGLGLAIVSRIMQWHNGEVKLSQSPQGGARFELRWPSPLRAVNGNAGNGSGSGPQAGLQGNTRAGCRPMYIRLQSETIAQQTQLRHGPRIQPSAQR